MRVNHLRNACKSFLKRLHRLYTDFEVSYCIQQFANNLKQVYPLRYALKWNTTKIDDVTPYIHARIFRTTLRGPQLENNSENNIIRIVFTFEYADRQWGSIISLSASLIIWVRRVALSALGSKLFPGKPGYSRIYFRPSANVCGKRSGQIARTASFLWKSAKFRFIPPTLENHDQFVLCEGIDARNVIIRGATWWAFERFLVKWVWLWALILSVVIDNII